MTDHHRTRLKPWLLSCAIVGAIIAIAGGAAWAVERTGTNNPPSGSAPVAAIPSGPSVDHPGPPKTMPYLVRHDPSPAYRRGYADYNERHPTWDSKPYAHECDTQANYSGYLYGERVLYKMGCLNAALYAGYPQT